MSTPISPRAELAAAIRAVNAAYGRLTPEAQESVEMVEWDAMEAALRSGDDDRAFAAVADWSHRQLTAIRAVAK
jgi:hypothetical protein